jgi:hypothetical protein
MKLFSKSNKGSSKGIKSSSSVKLTDDDEGQLSPVNEKSYGSSEHTRNNSFNKRRTSAFSKRLSLTRSRSGAGSKTFLKINKAINSNSNSIGQQQQLHLRSVPTRSSSTSISLTTVTTAALDGSKTQHMQISNANLDKNGGGNENINDGNTVKDHHNRVFNEQTDANGNKVKVTFISSTGTDTSDKNEFMTPASRDKRRARQQQQQSFSVLGGTRNGTSGRTRTPATSEALTPTPALLREEARDASAFSRLLSDDDGTTAQDLFPEPSRQSHRHCQDGQHGNGDHQPSSAVSDATSSAASSSVALQPYLTDSDSSANAIEMQLGGGGGTQQGSNNTGTHQRRSSRQRSSVTKKVEVKVSSQDHLKRVRDVLKRPFGREYVPNTAKVSQGEGEGSVVLPVTRSGLS